tara:strand:+ start:589 stop:903 length:315 start_codon:yes stop_codon:yes gene_type:complete
MEVRFQDALAYFNVGIPQWYGWKNLEDGEVYSNLKLNNDSATMPSEEEVNAKIAELQVELDRINDYPSVQDQLDMLYKDMLADKGDKTGDWFAAVKKVKDDNPK